MNSLPLLMQGLGSAGIFASRAFLPAFATALALRFGPELGAVGRLGLFGKVGAAPTWFTSDACLIVLGILSALEMMADRSPEVRDFLHDWVHSIKGVMAALTYLGVLKAADHAVIDPMIREAGLLDSLPAALIGGLTYAASVARGSAVRLLTPEGDHDPLGLGRVGRMIEEVWSVLGPWALLLFPILTLFLIAGAAAVMARVARIGRERDLASRVECSHCTMPIYASAPACPFCHREIDRPKRVGWLGGSTGRVATDRDAQTLELFAVGRCPSCAEHLGRRHPCELCGATPLHEPAFLSRYLTFLDLRVIPTALLCLVIGLIPVVGAVGGVLLCRLRVVGPLAQYLPMGRGLATRWTVRLASIGLIAFQWVPVLGALSLPTVVLINHAAYRRAFVLMNQAPAKKQDLIM